MLDKRITEYMDDLFVGDAEVFFELYRYWNSPIPSYDPNDPTTFLFARDNYYYLSEIYIEFGKRYRAQKEKDGGLHLPDNAEKIIQRYHTIKWDNYQWFSLLFPLWWGMREKQIRAIQGHYPKKKRWRAINYFLCHPEEDALPKDEKLLRCVFEGKYLRIGEEESWMDGVWVDAPEWILRAVELEDD